MFWLYKFNCMRCREEKTKWKEKKSQFWDWSLLRRQFNVKNRLIGRFNEKGYHFLLLLMKNLYTKKISIVYTHKGRRHASSFTLQSRPKSWPAPRRLLRLKSECS